MTEDLLDALTIKGGGAIDNGPTLPRAKAPRSWGGKTVATPVVLTFVPHWHCDSTACPRPTREGQGADGMLAHAARYHGRRGVFSRLDGQGA